MIKKILKFFLLLILVFVLFVAFYIVRSKWKTKNISKETITEELDTQTLYETRCGICHGGASPDAPTLSALKRLTEESIIATMQTGVMMNQAYMLSEKQHKALAKFISDVEPYNSINEVHQGMCNEKDRADYLSALPHIDGWGMGNKNHRYLSNESIKINTSNVDQLKLNWAFAFPNASRARVQPTVAGNTIFTASQTGTVYALDRHTGCIKWTYQADAEIRSALVIGRDSTERATHLYFGDFHASVYSFDLVNQKLAWKAKVDDHAVATITGTLSLHEDRLYVPISSTEILSAVDENYECCTFRGALAAMNKEDGSIIWKTHTIDEEPSKVGENSEGVAIMAPSGAPIWTGVTLDEKRRRLYVGTGENYTRPASNTSDAIIAFDMDTGKKVWVNQTLPEDAWNGACVTLTSRANCPEENGPDADFGAPPILVERAEGDLILAGQKSGFVYALDPDNNGEIVWQNLVGRGGTMGGIHWGMATDGTTLYVPINDRGIYSINKDKPKSPGLHAVNIETGKLLWSTIEEDRCPPLTLRGCGPGLSAAITLIPEIVFGGTLDGYMKAYSSVDGKELWSYDTKRDYEAVNGVRAFGGAIDSDGAVVVENQMFITSGYAKFAEKEGNVLLSFEVPN